MVVLLRRPSIANLIEDHVRQSVTPDEIQVTENPNETGSFYVGWRKEMFILSPAGDVAPDPRKRSLVK